MLRDLSGEDESENFPLFCRSFQEEFGVLPRTRGWCLQSSWNISTHVNVEPVWIALFSSLCLQLATTVKCLRVFFSYSNIVLVCCLFFASQNVSGPAC